MAFPRFNCTGSHLKSLLCGMAFAFLGATTTTPAQIAVPAKSPAVHRQPANVGDAKTAALAYHDSGAYDRDLATVASAASRWLEKRARSVPRPALVLDIDETALSNWEVIKLDDFGRPIGGPCVLESGAPCGWGAWDTLGR